MSPLQRAAHQGGAGVAAHARCCSGWRAQLVRSSYQGSRAHLAAAPRHGQRRRARVDLLHGARAGRRQPLCGFYAAAFTRLLALFDIGAHAEVVACRGTGEADAAC